MCEKGVRGAICALYERCVGCVRAVCAVRGVCMCKKKTQQRLEGGLCSKFIQAFQNKQFIAASV